MWLPLSERLERAFYGRVAELPSETQTLLFVAAENDGPSLHEVLRASALILAHGVDVATMRPAVAANLVQIDGLDIRFRHPLVRSAIHQAADPAMRASIHRALADVTRDEPDRHVWHKAAASMAPDEGLAVELDGAAERALRRGGTGMALLAMETAIRLSRSADERGRRFLQAAELAMELGQTHKAEEYLRKVEEAGPAPAVGAQIALIRELSEPGMVRDPSRVAALVSAAGAARSAGETALAVNLLWRAAQRCWWGDATARTRQDIELAAGQLEAPEASPHVTAILGYAAPLGNGHRVYRALAAFARESNHDVASARVLGSAANVVGAFELGLLFLASASAAARDEGRLWDLARTLFALSWAQVEVGDWYGALGSADEAAALAEESGGAHWVAAANIVRARVAAMRGADADCATYCAEAERIALPLSASFLLAMVQLARASAAVTLGRHGEAYDHLARIFDPADPAYNSSIQFYAVADLVDAAVGAGRREAASAIVSGIATETQGTPVPWVRASLGYARAVLAPPETVGAAFDEATLPDLKEWPFLRGRLLLCYGVWLRRQRRSADARAPLRIAHSTFDALGAAPWAERAAQELRATGEASRKARSSSADDLSPQEITIARLAARGLTNKEIGLRLTLSHRTVGYHLHRIFPKIGISSRAELRDALGTAAGAPDGEE